jgi:multidrug transporter EmrE-like cation transporter
MHPILWLATAIGTEIVATTALKLAGIGRIIIGVVMLNGAGSGG